MKTDKKDDSQNSEGMQMLLQQINELGRNVDQKLGDTSKQMNDSIREQTNESYRVIKDITERLTKLDEANKQVMSFTEQLQSLQDILKNPKHRGVLGEYYLETLLKNALPPDNYQMQFNLGKDSDGASDLIVDAVVFVKDKVIPIDSKFSLENYNRLVNETDKDKREKLIKLVKSDLKNRIDETAKYIRPNENTMDFAFMFLPSESMYYDLLIANVGISSRDLIEYAFQEKKVIVVSPTSFMAYLQTVLQGLRSLQIEEQAKEIQKRVGDLKRHIIGHEEAMRLLGKNLSYTVGNFNKAHKTLSQIDGDVVRITDGESDVDGLHLDRPQQLDE
jgi:DNA recombination protein RmuC